MKYKILKGTEVWLSEDSPNRRGNYHQFVTEKNVTYDESDLFEGDEYWMYFNLPKSDKEWMTLAVQSNKVVKFE